MSAHITVDLIDDLRPEVRDLLRDAGRRLPHLAYADARLEVSEGKFATAENGESKSSGDDYGFSVGVRVLAGERAVAPGWVGLMLGTADLGDLQSLIGEAQDEAGGDGRDERADGDPHAPQPVPPVVVDPGRTEETEGFGPRPRRGAARRQVRGVRGRFGGFAVLAHGIDYPRTRDGPVSRSAWRCSRHCPS